MCFIQNILDGSESLGPDQFFKLLHGHSLDDERLPDLLLHDVITVQLRTHEAVALLTDPGDRNIGPHFLLDLVQKEREVIGVLQSAVSLPCPEAQENDVFVGGVCLLVGCMIEVVLGLHPGASVGGRGR